MSNLSKREKILLIVLCVVIICYVYYNFILVPQLNELSSEKEKLTANNIVLNGLIESQKNIDKIKKEVDDLNKKALESVKSIPDTSRIPEIIMDFKNIEVSSGCTTGRILFGTPVANNSHNIGESADAKNNIPGIMILPIEFQVNGSFDNIMSMLKSIENNSRKMTINKISINKDVQNGLLVANASISCYFMNNGSGQKAEYPFGDIAVGKQNIFD